MKKTVFIISMIAIALIAFIRCEGPTGPQGEQGEQGEPGTANVIYSEWTTLSSAWRDSTFFGNNYKVNHLSTTDITQDVIDNGVVLCYAKYQTHVVPLPYNGETYILSFELDLNKIIFTTLKTDYTGGATLSSSFMYRYVVIPGGVLSTATKSTVDYTKLSYEQICLLFNIPE